MNEKQRKILKLAEQWISELGINTNTMPLINASTPQLAEAAYVDARKAAKKLPNDAICAYKLALAQLNMAKFKEKDSEINLQIQLVYLSVQDFLHGEFSISDEYREKIKRLFDSLLEYRGEKRVARQIVPLTHDEDEKVISESNKINAEQQEVAFFEANQVLGQAKKSRSKIQAIFQGTELELNFNEDKVSTTAIRFLRGESVSNGHLLGAGGSKSVFEINGKAVFMLTGERSSVEAMIHKEISLSQELSDHGFMVQNLERSIIQLYHPGHGRFYDYPCMVSDSFPTLVKQGIEVVDAKLMFRFGSKHRLYPNRDSQLDLDWNCTIFDGILEDIAALRFFSLYVDSSDSGNVVILPSEQDEAPQTRLFLYDFSTVSGNTNWNNLLDTAIIAAVEGETMAVDQARSVFTPKFVSHFKTNVYPDLKPMLLETIKKKLAEMHNMGKEAYLAKRMAKKSMVKLRAEAQEIQDITKSPTMIFSHIESRDFPAVTESVPAPVIPATERVMGNVRQLAARFEPSAIETEAKPALSKQRRKVL